MKGRTLLLGGILGALAAYFLDPKAGPSRRKMLGGTAGSVVQHGSNVAQQAIPHMASVANKGSASHTSENTSQAHDNDNPDDNTLRDRIESEIFRDPKYSREHLNILVVGGMVDLHGQLESQSDIDYIVERIGSMRNVKGVQSYLHLPGTPSPNKEESLDA